MYRLYFVIKVQHTFTENVLLKNWVLTSLYIYKAKWKLDELIYVKLVIIALFLVNL